MRFTVPGNPLPKQSYRAVKGGGYTPKRIKVWQELVGWCAAQAMAARPVDRPPNVRLPIESRVEVHLKFYRDNKRKVDLDNLSKAVLDGMNGIVYRDDSQIEKLTIERGYDKENPRVEVSVRGRQER